MGGFIQGQRRRVKGARLTCKNCGIEYDEQHFMFSTKGYDAFCCNCERERRRAYRMAHRYEYKNPHGIGYRVMSDNLERSLALEYKDKLSRLVREIRLGDMYRIGSRRAIVEMITGSYVLMRYSFGAHECFVWDDVYKIVNGTYKKGDNEDD